MCVMSAAVQFSLAGGHVTTCKSRRGDLQHVVRSLPTSVTTRLITVQSSPCRSAPRATATTGHTVPPGRRQDDSGGGGRRQRRGRRSADAGHSPSATDTSRLHDHQVQPTYQPGTGDASNTLLPLRWYVASTLYINALRDDINCLTAMQYPIYSRVQNFIINSSLIYHDECGLFSAFVKLYE